MLFVVRRLKGTTALRFVDGPLHRWRDAVPIEIDLCAHVAGRTADGLNQRGLTAEEALLVGVQDGHHGDLG